MKACVLHEVGDIRFQEFETPSPGAKEVLIKVMASGICGSDIPRIYKEGTYNFPTIPGHEFSGKIIKIGKNVKNLEKGDKGTVLPLIPCKKCKYCRSGNFAQCNNYDYLGSRTHGGFAEYSVVPEDNFLKLSKGVSFPEAAMVEPAAVALHALRRAGLDINDTVTVLGAGTIGLLASKLALIWGANEVFITDVVQGKLDFAEKLGFSNVFNSSEGKPAKWIKKQTEGVGTDLVIEAAGVSDTFEQAILISKNKGHIVVMGNPAGDYNISQKAVSQFLRKEVTIKGSWNSYFAEFPKNEWRVILNLLAEKKLNLKELITHQVSFSEMEKTFEMMKNNSEFYNKVMFINK